MRPTSLYKTRNIGLTELKSNRNHNPTFIESGPTFIESGSGFDIVHAINSTVPRGVELHLWDEGTDGVYRKSSFTGPNTNLKKRLKSFDNRTGSYSEVLTPPINRLDSGAMQHDIAYSVHKDLKSRHKADRELIKVANEVIADPAATKTQKRSAWIVKTILSAKLMIGAGISEISGGSSAYDYNELIAAAQRDAASSSFNAGNSWVYPLLGLALSIGLPALVSAVSRKLKK